MTKKVVLLLTMTAVASFASGAVIWSDGFESGDLSAWTSNTGVTVAGSYDYNQGQPRTGSYLATAASTGGVTAGKVFDTPLSNVGDEVGGYMSISAYNEYLNTKWALIYARNASGSATAWVGLKLDSATNKAKVYAHYGSMLADPSTARSEELGWDIQVDPYVDWVKVSFRLVENTEGAVDGMAIYVNDQKLPPLYTNGWQSFKDIGLLRFGSPWGSALSGYDDFYATSIPEPATLSLIGIGGLLMFRYKRKSV